MPRDDCLERGDGKFSIRAPYSDGDFDGLIAVATDGSILEDVPAQQFVRQFFVSGKPVAVTGDAVRILIAADVLERRTVTCPPSYRTEVLGAGGNYIDESVAAHHGLVTGRGDDDIDAFCTRMLSVFAEAPRTRHSARSTSPP